MFTLIFLIMLVSDLEHLKLLCLQTLSTNVDHNTNVDQSVEEGDEFSLSCIAYGSPSMSFHWYKDGVPINVTQAIR